MCGEKQMALFKIFLRWGSPPRVRGKEYAGELHRGQRGITPACAGKRTRIPGQRLPMWDHPRVCGEKSVMVLAAASILGSPPRVRGKACRGSSKNARSRITPACAGKSIISYKYTTIFWDHPRVCGEKCAAALIVPQRLGSPPRVRGKDVHGVRPEPGDRITPACAGKSVNARSVHALPEESPPRVRGKDVQLTPKNVGAGITPACAGKRFPGRVFLACERDHPRVCGEKECE